MELQHVNVKLPVAGALQVDPAAFIEVFHLWVKEQSMPELLIDVADYRHVPAGPGVMLIGHEADYAMDHARGQWGLLYNRKAALDGDNAARLGQAIRSAAAAALRLEAHFGDRLAFDRRHFDIVINDRLLAPNTPETLAACQPELQLFLGRLLGQVDFTLTPETEPRRRFGMQVSCGSAFDLKALAN